MGQLNSNNIPNQQMLERQIIIGIDFGTSGLCYSYGRLEHGFIEPHIGHFEGQDRDGKISNEIILDDNLTKVLAFGNACNSFLYSGHNCKFHHFKNVKMNLYKNLDKVKALNSDKEVDIEYIIKLILIETKKKAIEQIRLSIPNLDEKNIHYVITVPAIWDIKCKQKMIIASQQAGLIREDDDFSNFFALEPEAASIYQAYENNGKRSYEEIYYHLANAPFILCDFGSGTVDIVTHKKKVDNNILKFEELYPPVGDDLGSNKINEYFIDRVIKPLIGEDNLNQIQKSLYGTKDYECWVRFEKSIEEFKKNFNDLDQLHLDYLIDCSFFQVIEMNISEKIHNFNNNNKWKITPGRFDKYKIRFPFQIIYDFMVELISRVIELIMPITESIKGINTIIFCGGISVNPILYKIFDNSYLRGMHFIRAANPEIAISQGSVLFSNLVNDVLRKAKYTFGINVREKWKDSIHNSGGKKIFDKIEKRYYCENIFSKFITKGDELRPEEIIEKSYIINGPKATIELYKTEENDVLFCDQKDEDGKLKIWKFAEYEIDVGNDYDINEREIIVKMKLGGTFITSMAIYCKTNKKADARCLFE